MGGQNDIVAARPLIDAMQLNGSQAVTECKLGVCAACLVDAQKPQDARHCLGDISLLTMLGTQWPILGLLSDIQSQHSRQTLSCNDLFHPSLNWTEEREIVT